MVQAPLRFRIAWKFHGDVNFNYGGIFATVEEFAQVNNCSPDDFVQSQNIKHPDILHQIEYLD